MEAWGVSVIVGWTDMHDIAIRPGHLICGRTWRGSMFGGETITRSLYGSVVVRTRLDRVVFVSGFKGKDGVAGMVRAYLEKKVKVDEFITHNMTLDQINEAIELMKNCKWYRSEFLNQHLHKNKASLLSFLSLLHSIRAVLKVSPQ